MQIAQMEQYRNASRPVLDAWKRNVKASAAPATLPVWVGPTILVALFLASVVQVVLGGAI